MFPQTLFSVVIPRSPYDDSPWSMPVHCISVRTSEPFSLPCRNISPVVCATYVAGTVPRCGSTTKQFLRPPGHTSRFSVSLAFLICNGYWVVCLAAWRVHFAGREWKWWRRTRKMPETCKKHHYSPAPRALLWSSFVGFRPDTSIRLTCVQFEVAFLSHHNMFLIYLD